MLFFLASLALAAEPPCNVADHQSDIEKIWNLVHHGPYTADGAVTVATDVPSVLLSGAPTTYVIMELFDKNSVTLTEWMQIGTHGLTIPFVVWMRWDGTVTSGQEYNCEMTQSLALDFFTHLPP